MDYVYEIYGYPAYVSIHDYHDWMLGQQDEQRAKEKVQSAIPSIEKMIEAGMIDEYMIYAAYKAGREKKGKTSKNICGFDDVYTYCLGVSGGKWGVERGTFPGRQRKRS